MSRDGLIYCKRDARVSTNGQLSTSFTVSRLLKRAGVAARS